MKTNSKDFLVSTAKVAFKHDGVLAFTGTTSLNTSLEVSMEDQEIKGGQGDKTLYKYKYSRKLSASIEMAEWNLAYLAANVGSKIFVGLKDVYSVAECVTLVNGIGLLAKTPVGNVHIEKSDGSIIEVVPTGNTITIENINDTVNATYRYNTMVKRITIDAESTPMVGELVLTANKHNNLKGKVGEIQIEIPSFQLNGSFEISLESGGTTTTKLDGDALAVSGASCTDGTVYAYISEIQDQAFTMPVIDIAATPSDIQLDIGHTKLISIVGSKGGVYNNIGIEPSECTITSDDSSVATVADGVVTAISSGSTIINVDYDGHKDYIKVTVN